MSNRILLLAALLSGLSASSLHAAQIGEKVAEFRLTDAMGHDHSLEKYLASGKVVVLEFWSFKCTVSLASDERLIALQKKYHDRVVVLAVASNSNESADEIQRNAANLNLPFPILLDQDGALAGRLGATHTPSVFILDRHGVLRYRGALDNNRRLGERGRVAHAEKALEAVLTNRSVDQGETQVFGCSIKRKGL